MHAFRFSRRVLPLLATVYVFIVSVVHASPDVAVGDITGVHDYARRGDFAALSFTIFACNVGDVPLSWFALPNNQHPVIAQNFYRLHEGRLTQIGQAWVKHGFAANNVTNRCGSAMCQPQAGFTRLFPNCSDPYSFDINKGPNLGARDEIDPVTGYFNGSTANNHTGHTHSSISHGLQVKHADLAVNEARYFAEAHYITPDDAMAGNGANNVSYRETRPSGSSSDWLFTWVSPIVQMQPAITVWPGATFTTLESWPEDGRIIVAHKVTQQGELWRYEYAVYNMNSRRGVRAFSVPVGTAQISSVGFSAVSSHDELRYSNDPWNAVTGAANLTWSTATADSTTGYNPIRWGTMYNFWFDADAPPTAATAALTRAESGDGPEVWRALIMAPAAGDCNRNGRSDDADIALNFSEDLDGNDLPDECVFCTRSTSCGTSDLCVERACVGGWCQHEELLYGDADEDGILSTEDVECVLDAFAGIVACPRADIAPCEPDGGIDFDDVLAAIEAGEGSLDCCEEK